MTTFFSAMISLTMSRISSRADIGLELGELGEVDGLDQRPEDHALRLVVFVGLATSLPDDGRCGDRRRPPALRAVARRALGPRRPPGAGDAGREGSAEPDRLAEHSTQPFVVVSSLFRPCGAPGAAIERLEEAAARASSAGAAGDPSGEIVEALGDFAGRLDLRDHLAVIAGGAEELRLESEARP